MLLAADHERVLAGHAKLIDGRQIPQDAIDHEHVLVLVLRHHQNRVRVARKHARARHAIHRVLARLISLGEVMAESDCRTGLDGQ